MKLAEWVFHEKRKIAQFATEWEKTGFSEVNPEDLPPGEWDEHYAIWAEQQTDDKED